MIYLSSWMTTLPIMIIGMVGIILVISIIVLAVMLLNRLTRLKKWFRKGNDPSDRKLHVLPDRQDVELFSFLTSCIRAPGTVFL